MSFWGFSAALWSIVAVAALTFIFHDALSNLVAWVTGATGRVATWIKPKT